MSVCVLTVYITIWLLQLPAGKGGVYGPVKTIELTCASPALIDQGLGTRQPADTRGFSELIELEIS